ncbi:MAG: O-sialoglycoprotein endopeptidase [Bacillota bacterium]|nr:O-sialoglycoprotein endopeptidase [Bacillota bacterium]
MILAIDTSCYTTSMALMSLEGELLADLRRVLDVPLGKRGLAQSEALFQHTRNLPCLIEELGAERELGAIKAIGASVRPRPVEGSYMPVFLGGHNVCRILSAAMKAPLYEVSHQEGHMAAAMFSANYPKKSEAFLMCHFSGGTSEICLSKYRGPGSYSLELISYSGDLHAGQLVDRIGVALGLKFPTGQELEKLALTVEGEVPKIRTHMDKNGVFSFSGPETALVRLISGGLEPAAAARVVEETIARSLKKALEYAMEKTQTRTVLLAGGVMSNQYICRKLKGASLFFAEPRYATDNAVGVACLTLEQYKYSGCC